MRTYNTVNGISVEVEALYNNVTGRKQFTAVEFDIVNNSIIDAYQEVLLEYGIENFKFHEEDITVDTVADQNYVELDEYAFRIVSGTVRIPAEDSILVLMDEKEIYLSDPGADSTGEPSHYAYGSPSSTNKIKMVLWPIPDAVFTINMKVLKYPTDVITNFPVSLMSAIKHKAKSLSCLGLGLPQLQPGFDAAYERIVGKIKDGYTLDGPRHVGRTVIIRKAESVEGRIP